MLVITSTISYINVDMGDYYTSGEIFFSEGCWPKAQIYNVFKNSNHVEVRASDGISWALKHDNTAIDGAVYQVASVNGVAPTSLDDLYEKIKAIL